MRPAPRGSSRIVTWQGGRRAGGLAHRVHRGPYMTTENVRGLPGFTWLCIVLVVIGALNWALVGLFNFNLVTAIFGSMSAISRIVYILVGLAGLYLIGVSMNFRQPIGPRTAG